MVYYLKYFKAKSSPPDKKGSSDVWSRVTGSDGTENLPGYALPTVAFQLRVSLCHSADGLTDHCLPVCQRYSEFLVCLAHLIQIKDLNF